MNKLKNLVKAHFIKSPARIDSQPAGQGQAAKTPRPALAVLVKRSDAEVKNRKVLAWEVESDESDAEAEPVSPVVVPQKFEKK